MYKFCRNFVQRFCTEISIFDRKIRFLTKNFLLKFKFLKKKVHFWQQKKPDFWQKVRFLDKRTFDFCSKNLCSRLYSLSIIFRFQAIFLSGGKLCKEKVYQICSRFHLKEKLNNKLFKDSDSPKSQTVHEILKDYKDAVFLTGSKFDP